MSLKKLQQILFLFLVLTPPTSYSQIAQLTNHDSKSISWISPQSLNDIIEIARKEKKDILINCSASWCTPCKKMDAETLNFDSIISTVNQNFVSVKLYFDTSAKLSNRNLNDLMVNEIKTLFNLTTFPSFLFLDKNGHLLHCVNGFRNKGQFYADIMNSQTKEIQHGPLLSLFKSGRIDCSQMMHLLNQMKIIGKTDSAEQMAKFFIANNLNRLSDKQFLNAEVINFSLSNIGLATVSDKFFTICKNESRNIDSIMSNIGLSNRVIKYIANNSIVLPIISKNTEPNWSELEILLTNLINKHFSLECILQAKIKWYYTNKVWQEYTKFLTIEVNKTIPERIESKDIMSIVQINNRAMRIFQHSGDSSEINSAINWVNVLLITMPDDYNILDTKANLLYKIGRVNEAIITEEAALLKALNRNNMVHNSTTQKYTQVLQKMKRGEPTWKVN